MSRALPRRCKECGASSYGRLCATHFRVRNQTRIFAYIRETVTGPIRNAKLKRWEERLRTYFEVTNK